jgi:hypothetical protein
MTGSAGAGPAGRMISKAAPRPGVLRTWTEPPWAVATA